MGLETYAALLCGMSKHYQVMVHFGKRCKAHQVAPQDARKPTFNHSLRVWLYHVDIDLRSFIRSHRLGRADFAFLKISTQRLGSGLVDVDVKPHCSASACAVPLCARGIAGSVMRHSLSARNVAKLRSSCATNPGSRFAARRSSGGYVTVRMRSCQ